MKVLRIESEVQPGTGIFGAIYDPNEIPNNVTDFALCQICRITDNGVVLNNPQFPVAFENDIKNNTLDLANGWFLDMIRRNGMSNFMYYMDSFTIEQSNGMLGIVNDCGIENGATLSFINGATLVSRKDYAVNYEPNMRSIGYQGNVLEYPILMDNPTGHPPNRILDFQVHLLARTNAQITILGGFKWQSDGFGGIPQFRGLINNSSVEFRACVNRGITYQNGILGTNWVLI